MLPFLGSSESSLLPSMDSVSSEVLPYMGAYHYWKLELCIQKLVPIFHIIFGTRFKKGLTISKKKNTAAKSSRKDPKIKGKSFF